ncbi:M-phase inducer phosphatase 1 [Bonamia ostreae]|uniref:protein-tyrosine-phosphatase n=1 Tax=Bonamia ostreae TaxID=126728 RepID=A0ABV2AJX8_9EUKA
MNSKFKPVESKTDLVQKKLTAILPIYPKIKRIPISVSDNNKMSQNIIRNPKIKNYFTSKKSTTEEDQPKILKISPKFGKILSLKITKKDKISNDYKFSKISKSLGFVKFGKSKFSQHRFYHNWIQKNIFSTSKSKNSIEWVFKKLKCEKGKLFPSISPKFLIKILCGEFEIFHKIFVIDCRNDYEFSGGHIKGAININTAEGIKKFYKKLSCELWKEKIAIFFHCEFSSQRAPRRARLFRQIDRENNRYPKIDFPLVFLVDGGYKRFFELEAARSLKFCVPDGYVSMFDVGVREKRRKIRQTKLREQIRGVF